MTVLRVLWLQKLQILETNKALQELGLVEHQLRFTSTVVVNFSGALTNLSEFVYGLLKRFVLCLSFSYMSSIIFSIFLMVQS